MIAAFSLLREVEEAHVCGTDTDGAFANLARTISTAIKSLVDEDEITEYDLCRVRKNLLVAQEARQKEDWHRAAEECEVAVAFIADCYIIYTTGVLCGNYDIFRPIIKTLADSMAILIEAKFEIGDLETISKYATHTVGINGPTDHERLLRSMRG